MAMRTALLLAAWLAGTAGARAQNVHHSEIEPPLYPEIILETDDSFSADPGLSAFRQALLAASRSSVTTSQGRQLDPQGLLPLLADEVEFFIGREGRSLREEFVSLGLHPARRALEMAGRASRASDSDDPSVQARYGMYVFADLAREPTVGRTPWLAGRICTASYGRLSWPDWIALDEKLRFIDPGHWRIAASIVSEGADGVPPEGWPRPYQMVPMAPEQKASAGSLGIIAPNGDVVFFNTSFGGNESHFAPYFNAHLCFEKRERSWMVTAIAMRLD